MKALPIYFFLILTFLTTQIAYSQNGVECFVDADLAQTAYENSNSQTFSGQSLFPSQRILSIHLHLVADPSYNYFPNSIGVEDALLNLNDIFSRSGISFRYCEIDSVENYKYNDFNINTEIAEIKTLYYKAGVINIFVVEEINKPGIMTRIEGHTFFPGGDDIIIITKEDFMMYGLAHQMGHFLGIYHTYEDQFGNESVDGSNCLTAGDLLCDTPADKHVITIGCKPTYTVTDANGDKYHHPIENIMSQHRGCRCVFTIAQLNKMVYNLHSVRSYLK